MYPETNQQAKAAIRTKIMLRIKRVRSSSRCSRNDIWPPRSSSPASFFLLAFSSCRRDIAVVLNRVQFVRCLQPLVFTVRLLTRCGIGLRFCFARLYQRRINRCDGRGDGRSLCPGRIQFARRGFARSAYAFRSLVENGITLRLVAFLKVIEIHLALPGALEIVGGAAKFRQTLTQLPAELRQATRSKENQGSAENYQQLRS